MEIRYIDVSGLHSGLGIIPWIRSSSMLDLVAATMGQREVTEAAVPLPETRKVGGKVEQSLRDEVNDLAFPLDAPVDRHHACGSGRLCND